MWQTIDSAPKDGTRVLLFCPAYDIKVQFGYYIDSEYLSYGVSVDRTQGWVVQGQTIGAAAPSHWMPLPADPE